MQLPHSQVLQTVKRTLTRKGIVSGTVRDDIRGGFQTWISVIDIQAAAIKDCEAFPWRCTSRIREWSLERIFTLSIRFIDAQLRLCRSLLCFEPSHHFRDETVNTDEKKNGNQLFPVLGCKAPDAHACSAYAVPTDEYAP